MLDIFRVAVTLFEVLHEEMAHSTAVSARKNGRTKAFQKLTEHLNCAQAAIRRVGMNLEALVEQPAANTGEADSLDVVARVKRKSRP